MFTLNKQVSKTWGLRLSKFCSLKSKLRKLKVQKLTSIISENYANTTTATIIVSRDLTYLDGPASVCKDFLLLLRTCREDRLVFLVSHAEPGRLLQYSSPLNLVLLALVLNMDLTLMLSCFSPSSYSAVAVVDDDVVDYYQTVMKEISVVAVVIHEEETL